MPAGWAWSILSLLMLLASAVPVVAQSSGVAADDVSAAFEKVRREGGRVIIVDGRGAGQPRIAEAEAAGASLLEQAQTTAHEIKVQFIAIVGAVPDYWYLSVSALRTAGGDGSLFWPFHAIGLAVLFLAIGYLPARLFARWAHRQIDTLFAAEAQTTAARIAFLYLRAIGQAVAAALQVGLAFLITLAFEFEPWAFRFTIFLVLFGWLTYRVCDLFFANLFAVNASRHRLLAMTDAEARAMYRGANAVFIPMILVMIGCAFQESIGMDHHAHLLSLVVATGISALLLAHFVWTSRKTVAALIRGNRERPISMGKGLLASSWHLIALVYVAVAYSVLFGRLVLGMPDAMLLAIMPLLAVFTALAFYGAALWCIERLFQNGSLNRAFESATAFVSVEGEGEKEEFDASARVVEPAVETDPGLPTYKRLFVNAARLFAFLLGGFLILNNWGVSIMAPGASSTAVWKVLFLGFFAYLTWGAIKVAFDRRIAEEGGDVQLVPGEEGGGAGSRLGTLLPLIRNFILILLTAIIAMMVLVEFGMNVAPIFAGAGIVGLAIGFGAQTLVKDIISGVFFLIDDAFRKGEYIDIGSVKGAVEQISIRSMQLRHHNGPLHTVPFGDIAHVTNFSRDWVVMKLPLRRTYDTDAEKVRKMIKKLGQEMKEDPDLGPLFLQPLKSQGVIQMEDSAMIMRVKFMTRPGDQWGLRRVVFAKLRDLFEANGIRFANREVTVRLADDQNMPPLDDRARHAVEGAAARIIQDAEPDTEPLKPAARM